MRLKAIQILLKRQEERMKNRSHPTPPPPNRGHAKSEAPTI